MSAQFINLVSLTMTLFSEKVLISNRCISGLMPNVIKKSWTDSTLEPMCAAADMVAACIYECMYFISLLSPCHWTFWVYTANICRQSTKYVVHIVFLNKNNLLFGELFMWIHVIWSHILWFLGNFLVQCHLKKKLIVFLWVLHKTVCGCVWSRALFFSLLMTGMVGAIQTQIDWKG